MSPNDLENNIGCHLLVSSWAKCSFLRQALAQLEAKLEGVACLLPLCRRRCRNRLWRRRITRSQISNTICKWPVCFGPSERGTRCSRIVFFPIFVNVNINHGNPSHLKQQLWLLLTSGDTNINPILGGRWKDQFVTGGFRNPHAISKNSQLRDKR